MEGLGGSDARKSPYAGASCSFTSAHRSAQVQRECNVVAQATAQNRTVDGLALRQVVVVLAGEECIAVTADDAFDVAASGSVGTTRRARSAASNARESSIPVFGVVEEALHDDCW